MSENTLPRFFLRYNWKFGNSRALEKEDSRTTGLKIDKDGYNVPMHCFENERTFLCILGHTVLNEEIDQESIWKKVQANSLTHRFLRDLNGEFLLIYLNKKARRLHVMNDRFTSIPLYYLADSNEFVASVFYNDLWMWLRSRNRIRINESAFFEFLWLQRILGTKTYDTESRFLPAATWLVYDQGRIEFSDYWTPTFTKTKTSLDKCAAELAKRLRHSLRRKLSDGKKRPGLFLSGGTDSRIVLAAFQKPPICFTLTATKNNEYRVARQVAEIKKSEHIHLELRPDPYSHQLDAMVRLGGGLYSFNHSSFMGFERPVSELVDVVFHGHGIDYMFQGMYLPKSPIRFGPYTTLFTVLDDLPENLVSYFLAKVSYRLKGVELIQFVRKEHRKNLMESLRSGVREIISQGSAFCKTPYDYWEYLLVHALSRHYSHTNLSSMATCAEQRTIVFDNDVFDLYSSLPASYRLDAKIARMTLKMLDPRMARVKTANSNMPLNWSMSKKEIVRIHDRLLMMGGIRKQSAFAAPAEERTWPDRDRIIRNQARLKRVALETCRSEALATLAFLDMDAIGDQIPRWIEQPSGGGAFMFFLITLDRFLKQ